MLLLTAYEEVVLEGYRSISEYLVHCKYTLIIHIIMTIENSPC